MTGVHVSLVDDEALQPVLGVLDALVAETARKQANIPRFDHIPLEIEFHLELHGVLDLAVLGVGGEALELQDEDVGRVRDGERAFDALVLEVALAAHPPLDDLFAEEQFETIVDAECLGLLAGPKCTTKGSTARWTARCC